MPRNPRFGTEPFVICHWDTFDGTTFRVEGAATLAEAEERVKKIYGDRIRNTGADRVDIVDINGDVVKRYGVG